MSESAPESWRLADNVRQPGQRKQGFIIHNISNLKTSSFLKGHLFSKSSVHRVKPKLPSDTCAHSRLRLRRGALSKSVGPLLRREGDTISKLFDTVHIMETIRGESPSTSTHKARRAKRARGELFPNTRVVFSTALCVLHKE